MKIIVGGEVIGEVENFVPSPRSISEPGIVDINTLRPRGCTAMVAWNEDFAIEQLERMMRAPNAFPPPPALTNPCAEIPLGDLKPQKLFMAQQDWDDIVKWDQYNPDPAT